MQLKQLFTEEDAVSPVIGVILMVAITVILAAVIGTFVLNLGDQVGDAAPQAKFSFDYTESTDTLVITHESGDRVKATDLKIKDGDGDTDTDWDAAGGSTFATAGDSVTLNPVESDDTVRLIYDDGSGDTATIQKWSGPDA
ncbi:type IV pilin N-terminal domain-containing protein [Haladaptatus sp. DJG-WS-42]|uniref:type IV pilin N-terminal domain-containing protein n=1 Tax=Haladaptatus sp. DJG-WS-42 TaxID=3120516 RepID=UPI0030CB23B6